MLALTCCLGVFSACEEEVVNNPSPPTTQDGGANGNENGGDDENQEPLLQITGVSLTDKTVVYDGTEKKVEIEGTLPSGVSVTYTNNKATDVGTYDVKAVLSGTGYEEKTLTATLKIEKATISGITFEGDTFYANGETKSIYVTGTVPDGVDVVYAQNGQTQAGTYTVTATLSGKNYHTLTLTATMRVLPAVSDLAQTVVQSFGSVPDPWELLPETVFNPQSHALNTNLNFSSFVNVGNIPMNGMGKQLKVVYTELARMTTALKYVNKVYAVLGTIENVYKTYLDANPGATTFTYTGGQEISFGFTITLGQEKYNLQANVEGVSLDIYADLTANSYGGRVQLTNTTVLKYEVKENELIISTSILNAAAVQMQFVRDQNVTRGYIYEYLGLEKVHTATSALIEIDDTYTKIIGTKGDFLPASGGRNCEVYKNSTGALVGTEVYEKALIDMHTVWYPIQTISGITSVKKVDEKNPDNDLNKDTVYINGKSTALVVKKVSVLNPSRRFDIEFKEMDFYVYNATTEEYEWETIEVPMMFIQESHISSFATDFKTENDVEVAISASSADRAAILDGYDTLLPTYEEIKDLVTFTQIKAYCGVTDTEKGEEE